MNWRHNTQAGLKELFLAFLAESYRCFVVVSSFGSRDTIMQRHLMCVRDAQNRKLSTIVETVNLSVILLGLWTYRYHSLRPRAGASHL